MVPTVELKQKKMILLKETSTGRGIWGDGQGMEAMGRYMGRWAGRGSDGEVYGAIGRARKRWGGIWGDRQGAGVMGR